MSQVLNLVYDLEDQIRNQVAGLPCVRAEELGLDRRAAYSVWIDEDALIVRKDEDRTLQYYGGFEYVDKDARTEVGNYVIYTNDDSRVADCLEQYYEQQFSDAEASEAE
jgi:mannose/cellobiose epimerase-like protein (N-acyl-D-glucosamine 2-epimerase family)